MNKKELLYQRINEHGKNLNNIFHTDIDNISLCKKLFRLENKGNRLATDYCNGNIEENYFDIEKEKTLKSVNKILNFIKLNIPVFFNSDPRGYALKIEDDFIKDIAIHKDWGGYGILAPDFKE